MKTIRSKDNPTYKDAARLLRKKYRDQAGMFLLEGPRPVMDALKSGNDIEEVFLREDAADSPQAKEAEELCAAAGVKLAALSKELFGRLSDTEHAQGILAIARKRQPQKSAGPAVILDRLQDPGNIGTIIRTAEAAGFGSLIAIKGTGDIYSPKTARAAAGSLLRVDVFEGLETAEALRLCREQGLRVIASDLNGAVEYTSADLTGDIALVIGNEGSGVSDEIRSGADEKVKIPMEGNIESLNAAAAAAVLMYEAARQRRAAGKAE